MSLNRLPTVEYDPGVVGIYVVIRSDAGYWTGGSSFDPAIANAAHVAVAEGDVPTIYRAAEADLAGLPAGDYEVIGFRPPVTGETGDQYIGRDDDWRWDGDSGEALVETVEAGAAAAIEAAGLTAGGGGGGGDGDGDTPMVVTLATNLAAPAAGARVWLTSDAAGANRLSETKAADDAGRVTFLVNPGVTYYVWSRGGGMADVLGEAVVGGAAASVVTTAASVDLASDSYLGVDEGRARLATLPSATPGAGELAACDDATFAAWLLMATVEVDADGPYQGRRFDPNQTLEFPRIPYGGNVAAYARDCYRSCGTGAPSPVWDWDANTNAAVVPAKVKTATLLQACDGASAAGQDRRGRAQAIADGLASQAVGSLSESYRSDAQAAPLCLPARRLLNFYRLRQGELL